MSESLVYPARCETIVPRSGLRCTWQAKFAVGIGTRRSDRQLACPRHLGTTVELALITENRPGAIATVEQVFSAEGTRVSCPWCRIVFTVPKGSQYWYPASSGVVIPRQPLSCPEGHRIFSLNEEALV